MKDTIINKDEWLDLWKDVILAGGSIENAFNAVYSHLKSKYFDGHGGLVLRVESAGTEGGEDVYKWLRQILRPERLEEVMDEIKEHDLFSDAKFVEVFYEFERKVDVIPQDEWFGVWEDAFASGESVERSMDITYTFIRNKFTMRADPFITHARSLDVGCVEDLKEWIREIYNNQDSVRSDSYSDAIGALMSHELFSSGGDVVELRYGNPDIEVESPSP